jgi:hypothetical protein
MAIMTDIAEIMQKTGMHKYKQMQSVLKSFRDYATAAMIPQLPRVQDNMCSNCYNRLETAVVV